MARITICDWCKDKFPSLVHNLVIDHFPLERQDGCQAGASFEICSGCREEIKTRLESLEPLKKVKLHTRNNEAVETKTGPTKICDHAMEISENNGNFELKCTKCGEKGKA